MQTNAEASPLDSVDIEYFVVFNEMTKVYHVEFHTAEDAVNALASPFFSGAYLRPDGHSIHLGRLH